MKQELEQELYNKYPKLFAEVGMSPTRSCMAFGCDHNDGWFPIIKRMCGLIQNHITQTRKNIARIRGYNRALRQAINGNPTNLKYHFKNRLGWNDEQAEEYVKRDVEGKTFRQEFDKPPTQLVFTQIKEKFGTLRVYSSGGDEFCNGVIAMAESMSAVTCEDCGLPGKAREGGWIRTLCDTCEEGKKTRSFT